MNQSARSAAVTLASAVVLAVAWAQPAAAAASRFGQNLGDQARGLLVALFLTVAGLVALPVLGPTRRQRRARRGPACGGPRRASPSRRAASSRSSSRSGSSSSAEPRDG